MIEEVGHTTATLYDHDGKVVGAITGGGTQIQPAPTNVGRAVVAWSPRVGVKMIIGEVVWDGAAPDLHGGFTHGELMPPTIDPPDEQFRMRDHLPSLINRLKMHGHLRSKRMGDDG